MTDASKDGFGYMWAFNGRIVFGGMRWSRQVEDNMPELEATAICIALETLSKFGFRTKGATLYTDSMTAIHAEQKGHSKSLMLNRMVGITRTHNVILRHVRSEENPADGISRGCPVSEEDIRKLGNLC